MPREPRALIVLIGRLRCPRENIALASDTPKARRAIIIETERGAFLESSGRNGKIIQSNTMGNVQARILFLFIGALESAPI